MKRLCDRQCNKCPLVNYPNGRMIAAILNTLHDALEDTVYITTQHYCPNLTVCPDCRIDDFTHVEGCEICHP